MSGIGAALVLHKLLPADPRRELIHQGITGERLLVALEAVEALREAAVTWQRETVASAGGNGEGQGKPEATESGPWITTSEAAQILDVTTRRVRQLAEEGALSVVNREGGHLRLRTDQVLALHRRRSEVVGRASSPG